MNALTESIKEVERCPECSQTGTFLPPPKTEGKKLIITFVCPNGHTFTKVLDRI